MGLLSAYAVVSIFFSFLCSILEAVLLSVTPTFIKVKEQENAGYVKALKTLKDDVDKPLIAILTLNTLAHTVGAILVGVQAENMVADSQYNSSYFGIPFVGIVSGVMTILILVVSEIIPKTIGATYWQNLTGFSTTVLKIMVAVLKYTGILWILQLTTKAIGKSAHMNTMTREEFLVITDTAEKDGVFAPNEGKFLKSLLQHKSVKVEEIMTPRSVMFAASQKMTIKEFFKENPNLQFSRIPVYGENSDDIKGYILRSTILMDIINDSPEEKLEDIIRPITMVSAQMSVSKLFEKMVATREHMALVINDYGTVEGLVTMEDAIETMLGLEIMDEIDSVEDMQELARNKWKAKQKK